MVYLKIAYLITFLHKTNNNLKIRSMIFNQQCNLLINKSIYYRIILTQTILRILNSKTAFTSDEFQKIDEYEFYFSY